MSVSSREVKWLFQKSLYHQKTSDSPYLWQVKVCKWLLRRGAFWCLDIMDSTGADLIKGIPLITGANLLAQYRYLGLGFSLYVNCDDPANDNPTQTDLGIKSHLYAVTE